MSKTKVCTRCAEEKEVEHFNRHKLAADGRQGVCRACNVRQREERRARREQRDPELIALGKVGEVMDGLDEGARARVLSYMLQKYGEDPDG